MELITSVFDILPKYFYDMAASVDQSIDNVSPKRVIIRLQQSDFNDRDPELPARIYLEKFRSLNEFGENRHFIHIQPPSPGNNDNDDNGNSNDNREKLQFPENDYKIHVIIDIEKDQFSGPLGEDFPHEMYRLKRVDGDL